MLLLSPVVTRVSSVETEWDGGYSVIVVTSVPGKIVETITRTLSEGNRVLLGCGVVRVLLPEFGLPWLVLVAFDGKPADPVAVSVMADDLGICPVGVVSEGWIVRVTMMPPFVIVLVTTEEDPAVVLLPLDVTLIVDVDVVVVVDDVVFSAPEVVPVHEGAGVPSLSLAVVQPTCGVVAVDQERNVELALLPGEIDELEAVPVEVPESVADALFGTLDDGGVPPVGHPGGKTVTVTTLLPGVIVDVMTEGVVSPELVELIHGMVLVLFAEMVPDVGVGFASVPVPVTQIEDSLVLSVTPPLPDEVDSDTLRL